MSQTRQTVHACPKLPSPITTLVYEFAHGHAIPEHFHPEDQLAYATLGVMTVRTSQGTWVVPAQRAVWIPARTPHSIVMSGHVSMRTLYLRARMVRRLPRTCCVVNVSTLLKELIIHACTYPNLSRKSKLHAHLIDVLLDQLETVRAIPLQLPNPFDARAVRVAQLLQRNPANKNSLDAACKQAGASKRTIERIFRDETRLSLGEMAATTSPDEIIATACRGRENYSRRAGSRLQHTQRFYRNVPENSGDYASTILRESSRHPVVIRPSTTSR
jgi:AraC-like DNA-binding protein